MHNFVLKRERLYLHKSFVSKLNNSCLIEYTDLSYMFNLKNTKIYVSYSFKNL